MRLFAEQLRLVLVHPRQLIFGQFISICCWTLEISCNAPELICMTNDSPVWPNFAIFKDLNDSYSFTSIPKIHIQLFVLFWKTSLLWLLCGQFLEIIGLLFISSSFHTETICKVLLKKVRQFDLELKLKLMLLQFSVPGTPEGVQNFRPWKPTRPEWTSGTFSAATLEKTSPRSPCRSPWTSPCPSCRGCAKSLWVISISLLLTSHCKNT